MSGWEWEIHIIQCSNQPPRSQDHQALVLYQLSHQGSSAGRVAFVHLYMWASRCPLLYKMNNHVHRAPFLDIHVERKKYQRVKSEEKKFTHSQTIKLYNNLTG